MAAVISRMRWIVLISVLILAACSGTAPTTPTPGTAEPTRASEPTEAGPDPTEAPAPTPTTEPTTTLEALEPYISPRENAEVVPAPRVIGYFSSWGIYGRSYHVKNIETSGAAEKLNVINYAFAGVFDNRCILGDPAADTQRIYGKADSVNGEGNGPDQLRGHFGQILKLKEMHPNLKALIAIGGWTFSAGFSDAALTQESREAFVQTCIDIFIRGNLPGSDIPGVAAGVFDGIDIDWEYPAIEGKRGNVYRPEDTRNFTLLLAEFRRQLDEIDPNLLLTIAAPAGESYYSLMELDQIHPYLDGINVMTYDYHGTWDRQGPTNHLAPLYPSEDDPSAGGSIDESLQAYLDAGTPPHKLTMGLPFYGRGWTGVANENNGLYQPAEEPAIGQFEPGNSDYGYLRTFDYPEFRDPLTQAYWIFDGTTFWSFDDPESVRIKMQYVREKSLGGAMLWELAGDTRDGELIAALYEGLFGDE
jgi:chitinase